MRAARLCIILRGVCRSHCSLCSCCAAQLFGVSEIPVSSVLSFVQLHLIPASSDPVVIPYSIQPYSASATAAATAAAAASVSAHPGVAPTEVANPSPSQVQCFDLLTYAPMLPNLAEAHRDTCSYSGLKLAPPPVLQPVAAKHTDKVSRAKRGWLRSVVVWSVRLSAHRPLLSFGCSLALAVLLPLLPLPPSCAICFWRWIVAIVVASCCRDSARRRFPSCR